MLLDTLHTCDNPSPATTPCDNPECQRKPCPGRGILERWSGGCWRSEVGTARLSTRLEQTEQRAHGRAAEGSRAPWAGLCGRAVASAALTSPFWGRWSVLSREVTFPQDPHTLTVLRTVGGGAARTEVGGPGRRLLP